MKGQTIEAVRAQLEQDRLTTEDHIIHPKGIEMGWNGDLRLAKKLIVQPTSWAHQQIAGYLDIPKAYYDRMLASDGALLATNVNHWMQKNDDPKERRLLRTVSGRLRGFLSNSFRPRDSYDLLRVVLPILYREGFEIHEAELTDKRMYIKATLPTLRGEVKVGDVVSYGIIISTSDVGAGSTRIEEFFMRLSCMNGMVAHSKLRERHVGKKLTGGDEDEFETLSQETLQADNEVFFMKVRDKLESSIKPENFRAQIEKMKEAASVPITNFDAIEVVKRASVFLGINSKAIRENVVASLANGNEGAGYTKWGLVNSFTAAAKMDGIGYDDRVELERAGGRLLAVGVTDWKHIAAA